MTTNELSRRRLMQMGLSAAATAGLVSTGGGPLVHASELSLASQNAPGGLNFRNSISNAYRFLNQMMDAYAQGSTIRLCQSYSDQIAGGTFFSTAFVYDNALLALAYLARGKW